MASTVHLNDKLHTRLRAIAEAERRPIGKVIEDAIQQYERKKFWREAHDAVERLRADPVAWEKYQDETASFEGGSMDGLRDEEPYYTPEEEEAIRAERARAEGR